MRKIEKFIVAEGRRVRFTNFVDSRSIKFERNAKGVLPEACLDQQLTYLNHVKREFYLMQVTASDGKPGSQTVIYVGRPKILSLFGMATVPSFPSARNEFEEEFAIKILSKVMKWVPGVMTLRIQAKRFESEKLSEFVGRAEKNDYFASAPMGPVRTLMIDLQESTEELYGKLPQKTRQKIRHASRENVIISEITDAKYIETFELALQEAHKRTGGDRAFYDFKTIFQVAKLHPSRAKVLGLALKSNPDAILAYVVGYRSGVRAEYSSAGSFSHPELRTLPYNYLLLWELMNWARSSGAMVMDLGGITHGGENDPLKGISRFKRSFPADEIELGREVIKVIRPSRLALYSALKNLGSGFRWTNPVRARKLIYD